MTHCDKKPRGKVGGSAISVYQALLHPHTESLGCFKISIFTGVSVFFFRSVNMSCNQGNIL